MSRDALHPTSGYSHSEEWANALTHGVGVALSLTGLVVAVVLASLHGDPFLIVACAIYGTTLLLLHLASTLYHTARDLRRKKAFLVADHSCIYLLIAGTYTPFVLGPLRGAVGWTLFGVIWGLALLGILRECLCPRRGSWVSVGIYLAMGWLVVFVLGPLVEALSAAGLALVLGGGLLYSVGVLFYKWHGLRFHHAIWHVFVMAGATCQFLAVLTLMG